MTTYVSDNSAIRPILATRGRARETVYVAKPPRTAQASTTYRFSILAGWHASSSAKSAHAILNLSYCSMRVTCPKISFPCIWWWYSLTFVFTRLAFAIALSPAINSVEGGLINTLPTNLTQLIDIFNTTNPSTLASTPLTIKSNLTTTPECYRPSAPFTPTSDPPIAECIAAANFMTSSLPSSSTPRTWSATVPYPSRWNMGYCEIYLDSPFGAPQDVFSVRDVAEEAIRIAMFCARREDWRRTTGGVMGVGSEGGGWQVKVKPRQIPRGR